MSRGTAGGATLSGLESERAGCVRSCVRVERRRDMGSSMSGWNHKVYAQGGRMVRRGSGELGGQSVTRCGRRRISRDTLGSGAGGLPS